jgi:hypothetical protein
VQQDDEASVNAFAFHPFDDHLVATAAQDAKGTLAPPPPASFFAERFTLRSVVVRAAHLWRFPEGGLTSDITTPVQTFAGGHSSRLVYFPSRHHDRKHLLFSASSP